MSNRRKYEGPFAAQLRVFGKAQAIGVLLAFLTPHVIGQSTDMSHSVVKRHLHQSRAIAEKPLGRSSEIPTKRPGAVTVRNLQILIPDVIVLDQEGKKRHFYSDLIKDKVVVLSFFYTKCVSACPTMAVELTQLQTSLGERLGKEVFIVTVSKDPETDTPQELSVWGRRVGVKPGWTMVTGETSVIAKIIRDFTGERLGRDSHEAFFLLGDDKTGNWIDLYGTPNGEEIMHQLFSIAALDRP